MKMVYKQESRARLALLCSMIVFGTIGIFRKYIALPSGFVAMARGLVGALFLLGVIACHREKPSRAVIRRNLPLLLLSGVLIGFNWILLFEAYNYTTVAIATLCYYMAPTLVILLSPLILRERLTARGLIAVVLSLCGMVPVSGVLQGGFEGIHDPRGILLGLGAALLYACVILCNKKLTDVGAYDKTTVQLAAAGVVLIPYTLFFEVLPGQAVFSFDLRSVGMLLTVCVVHTGISYALYFGSMSHIGAQTVALFSYLDPVLAILLSALLLEEPFDIFAAVGAAMILGAALIGEWPAKQK